jgi:hypothetical protein
LSTVTATFAVVQRVQSSPLPKEQRLRRYHRRLPSRLGKSQSAGGREFPPDRATTSCRPARSQGVLARLSTGTATFAVVQWMQSHSFQQRLRWRHRDLPSRRAQRWTAGGREFPRDRATVSSRPARSQGVLARLSTGTATFAVVQRVQSRSFQQRLRRWHPLLPTSLP